MVYSAKNTFFATLGDVGHDVRWVYSTLISASEKGRLCSPYVKEHSFDTLTRVQSWHDRPNGSDSPSCTPNMPFETLPAAGRCELLDEQKKANIMNVWGHKIDAYMAPNVDLLRLDLTNYRCPSGCCRMGEPVLELLIFNVLPNHVHPQRIEIWEAPKAEHELFRATITLSCQTPLNHVILVDKAGCTCEVSTQALLVKSGYLHISSIYRGC